MKLLNLVIYIKEKKGGIRTKNKTILILIVIILNVLICSQVNASSKIKFSVEDVKDVERSSTITVKIKGENIENCDEKLVGLKFDLYYNNEQLEYISSKKGEAVSGTFDLSENYEDEGRVRIGIVTLSSINTSGTFYELTFKVKDDIKEQTGTFKIEVKEASSEDGKQLECDTQDGTITYISDLVNKNEKIEEIQKDIEEEIKNKENGDIKETIIISVKDTNKNIKDIANLDSSKNLTYKVEDENILQVDEDGRIIAKTEGKTNIIVTDEDGYEEIIPIEVSTDGQLLIENSTGTVEIPKTLETSETAIDTEDIQNSRSFYVILIVIIVFLLLTVALIFFAKKKKRRSQKNEVCKK